LETWKWKNWQHWWNQNFFKRFLCFRVELVQLLNCFLKLNENWSININARVFEKPNLLTKLVDFFSWMIILLN
jgi:hypothetical protein